MVNLKDVSKKSNVSIATASRYINKVGFISEELQIRIGNAIKELNYVPNKIARSLSKGRTGTIGIIIPDITNPFFPELVKGISDYLSLNNYHAHLCNSDVDPKKEELFVKDFKSMWVDGIVIYPLNTKNRNFKFLNEVGCPIVIIGSEKIDIQANLIAVNNEKSSFKAVNYLIENGHKKIIYLGGQRFVISSQKRYSGWKKAMHNSNLSIEDLEFCGNFDFESGFNMMKEALKRVKNIDAVFAENDMIAIGAMRALKDKGIDIPGDISIIGFDDISISKFLTPALTTIHQPTYEIGKKSAEILLKQILKKSDVVYKRIILDCELSIRDSVKKIN